MFTGYYGITYLVFRTDKKNRSPWSKPISKTTGKLLDGHLNITR